jgi:hypothetical protein
LITSAVEEHTCLMSKTMRLKNVMFDIHCCWTTHSMKQCFGFSASGFRFSAPDPDPVFWWPKIEKNLQLKIFIYFFDQKLQFTSALQREHPGLQNMKFLNFFLFLWVIFALLDPDPLIGLHPDPIRIRIRNTAIKLMPTAIGR